MKLPSNLPTVGKKRIAVKVTHSAEKHIRKGHPWVFDGGITSVSYEGAPGDLAVIFDQYRRFAAIGLYDPQSPIRVKILQHGESATINAAWFHSKIAAAHALRAPIAQSDTTGYRIINGENDSLPGLIADRYDDTVVVKLYSEAWMPHLRDVLDGIEAEIRPNRIIIRLSRQLQESESVALKDGMTVLGIEPDEPVEFVENGLNFEADVIKGQKTGFFLDQRDNRQRVRELANGAEVLDLFASTGGFSLYAAAGGAHTVTSVDLSNPTLAAAKRNFALNRHVPSVAQCNHKLLAADAFDTMAKMARNGRRFDMVIIDPPSFARKQLDVPAALDAYAKLTEVGLTLVKPGGTLVQASCSSRVSAEAFYQRIEKVAKRKGRDLREIARTGHAIDHPVSFKEGAYLKCLFARVS